MADNAWMNNPKIRNIDPRKLSVLLEIMKEAEGKSMDQLLPLLINANQRLQSENLNFSKDESEVLIDLLTRNLTPREKMQFEMLKQLIMGRK